MKGLPSFPVVTLLLCLLLPSTALAQDLVEPPTQESDASQALALELSPFDTVPVCAENGELQLCVTAFTLNIMGCGNWYQLSFSVQNQSGEPEGAEPELLSYRLGDAPCGALPANNGEWHFPTQQGRTVRLSQAQGVLRLELLP